jgi:hypothetical protein
LKPNPKITNFTEQDWYRRVEPFIEKDNGCWIWCRSARLKIAIGRQKQSIRALALWVFRKEYIETTTKVSCKNIKCCNPDHILNSEEERFWYYVVKAEGCWSWKGPTVRDGYGCFGSKTKQAHRYSYEIHKGPIPKNLLIRHSCHNPSCTNPEHLSTGTKKDNSRDMFEAQRENILKGVDNGQAKLTNEKVLEIRELGRTGNYTYQEIGDKFSVTKQTAMAICKYKTWKHL